MPLAVDLLRQIRRFALGLVDGLTDDQWLAVPDGSRNNVLWNVGHLVVTQQLLHYGLAGLPLNVPEALLAQCRKGTSPAEWDAPPDRAEVSRLFLELPDQLEADLAAGRFASFRAYETSTGVVLRSIDEALAFNLYHEGLHGGTLLELRRRVG